MTTNYLAVVCCDHCREMIRTMSDGSIICACTTKRSCEHPEGMGDCHECTIARLQERVEEAERRNKLMEVNICDALNDAVHYRNERDEARALAERRKEAIEELDYAIKKVGDFGDDTRVGQALIRARAAINMKPEEAKEGKR